MNVKTVVGLASVHLALTVAAFAEAPATGKALRKQAPVKTAQFVGDQNQAATRVMARDDGSVSGRLSVLTPNGLSAAPGMSVTFLRDGRIAAQARSGADGTYQVTGLSPGTYSMVARGPAGFATMSVVVDRFNNAAQPGDVDFVLDTTVIPAGDLQTLGNLPGGDLFGQPPLGGPGGFPGGVGGGFGGGGGGNGNGFGGLGALLGVAGIGLGAAALSNNRNEGNQNVASPNTP